MSYSSNRLNYSNLDRSFKTIVLDEPLEKVRVRAIDVNQESQNIYHQSVDLDISSSEFNPLEDLFRVRARTSMAIDGVVESHWVLQREELGAEVEKLNQYRIRSVSDTHMTTSWIYSNIKTEDNEDILFELIHDLLDLSVQARDSEVDFLMESMLDDLFHALYDDKNVGLVRLMYENEDVGVALKEIVEMISSNLRNAFDENVVSSYSEFSRLLKTYKVMDEFQTTHTDFTTLLIEAFVNDQLDQIVRSTYMEALLESPEEKHALISSAFDFDVKGYMLEKLYDSSVGDMYTIRMTDWVQLLSDPEFYYNFAVDAKEDFYRLFRNFLKDVYGPLVCLSEKSVELESWFKDDVELNVNDSVVQYERVFKDTLYIDLILDSIVELLSHDSDNFSAQLLIDLRDIIETPMLERDFEVWIHYNPEGLFEFLLGVYEDFNFREINKKFNYSEGSVVEIEEGIENKDMTTSIKLSESMVAMKEELVKIIETTKRHDFNFRVVEAILESYKIKDMSEVWPLEEDFTALVKEIILKEETSFEMIEEIYRKISFKERFESRITSSSSDYSYEVSTGYEEEPFRLFKILLLDEKERTIKDLDTEIMIYLRSDIRDIYFLPEADEVDYLLGSFGGRSSLGEFVLGTSTLLGEKIQGENGEVLS